MLYHIFSTQNNYTGTVLKTTYMRTEEQNDTMIKETISASVNIPVNISAIKVNEVKFPPQRNNYKYNYSC